MNFPSPLLTFTIALLVIAAVFAVRFRRRKARASGSEELDRHQLELARYLASPKTDEEIGLMYERQIGFVLETAGYDVIFHGAINGMEDLGIDLIAQNRDQTLVVQAKCWSKTKIIDEELILRLIESAYLFQKTKGLREVIPVFYSTTEFTIKARELARLRKMELRALALNKDYPMIKCNVSRTGERIFHLPTDEFYDKVKIKNEKGAFYTKTVAEAVEQGFRRAYKYRGPNRRPESA